MKTRRSKKSESANPKFLHWLVESRRQNQKVSADLYELLLTTPKCWKNRKLEYEAKTLISIGFSLWRAAFLANRPEKQARTNKHATWLLGEMLETNAISFPQDRKSKAFTFNFYIANVRFRLKEFKEDNRDFKVDERLLEKWKLPKTMSHEDRWLLYQEAFADAVKYFEDRLRELKKSPVVGRTSRTPGIIAAELVP
jgi:hypothetical protein